MILESDGKYDLLYNEGDNLPYFICVEGHEQISYATKKEAYRVYNKLIGIFLKRKV